jgi:hypothetical protein
MDSIMSLLPNDIIMQIIRTADGGRVSHKKKLLPMLQESLLQDHSWMYMQNGCRVNLKGDDKFYYVDDLSAFEMDRREHYDSDEEYMDMVRNREEYRQEYC